MSTQPALTSPTQVPPTGPAERLLRLCARETSSGRFIPQIDGLRSLAVLAVVCFHLDMILGKPAVTGVVDGALTSILRRGFLGVPIFFSISAFIVALPFAQRWFNAGRQVSISGFYLRRLTRLEPPYIINMVLIWLAGAALGKWALTETGLGLLSSLAYQHNQLFGMFSTINSVAWSLEVEFQFYLLAPVITLVFAVRPRWGRWLILLLVTGLVVALRRIEVRRVELSLLGQFESFAAGLVVVDVYLTVWRGQMPQSRGWDVVGLVSWLAYFGLSRLDDPILRAGCQFPLLITAMLGSLGGRWLGRVFGNRWVFTFGGMCYSFYLWHQWLLTGLVPLVPNHLGDGPSYLARYAIIATITLPVMFAICTLAFIALEKPFMRRDWPQRFAAWAKRVRG